MKYKLRQVLAAALAAALALAMALPAAAEENMLGQDTPVTINGQDYIFCVTGTPSLDHKDDEENLGYNTSPVQATVNTGISQSYRIALLESNYEETGGFTLMWDLTRALTDVSVSVVDMDGNPVSGENAAFTVSSVQKDQNEIPYFTLTAVKAGFNNIRISATYEGETFVRYATFTVVKQAENVTINLSNETVTIQDINEVIADTSNPCCSEDVSATILLPAGSIAAGSDGKTVIEMTRPFHLQGDINMTEIQGSIHINFSWPQDTQAYLNLRLDNLFLNGETDGARSSASGIYGNLHDSPRSRVDVNGCAIKGFRYGIEGTSTSVTGTAFENNGVALLIEQSLGSFTQPRSLTFINNDVAIQLGRQGGDYQTGNDAYNPLFRLSITPLSGCIFQNNKKNFSHEIGGSYTFFMPNNLYLDANSNPVQPKPGDFEGNGKVCYTPYYMSMNDLNNENAASTLLVDEEYAGDVENIMLNDSVTNMALPERAASLEVVYADDENNLTTLATWSFAPAASAHSTSAHSTSAQLASAQLASARSVSGGSASGEATMNPSLEVSDEGGYMYVLVKEVTLHAGYSLGLTVPFAGEWSGISVTSSDGEAVEGAVWNAAEHTAYFPVTAPGVYTVTGIQAEPVTPSVPSTPGTTVTNPDGSVTTTVTNTVTGAVTETTRYSDGTRLQIVTASDGERKIAVTVPDSVSEATVSIPVVSVTPGTVAVDAATGEVVKRSIPTEDGLDVTLAESAELIIVDNGRKFDDAGAHWAKDAITFVSARELFNGVSDTAFAPDSSMSRAMLMTVLARLEGVDTASGGEWYESGMAWAVEHGISDGSAGNSDITREQLAVMLYRYFGEPETGGSLDGFADAANVSSWARDALSWAVESGLIVGTGDGRLDPGGRATRAEVATILMRFMCL